MMFATRYLNIGLPHGGRPRCQPICCRVRASSNGSLHQTPRGSQQQQYYHHQQQHQQQQQQHHQQQQQCEQHQLAHPPKPASHRMDLPVQGTYFPVLEAPFLAPCSTLAVLALALGWCAAAGPAAAADGLHHHGSNTLVDLAEGEEFWGNVAKYGRYFVTVMLGTGYVMVQPLLAALKRPVTAAVAVAVVVGGFILVRFTLSAMLGLQEPFDYQPGSIVPYS